MRLGAKLPNDGGTPLRLGVARMARALETAGFDSIWTTDHIVQPETIDSVYPFSPDGRAEWAPETPWLDSIVVLSQIAAATSRVELGLAVLIAPLRHPLEAAKQLATIDVLAGGRVVAGIGAGWMREEYEALGVDFASRGRRLEEWIAIVRAAWTGRIGGFDGDHYRVPHPVRTEPTPRRTPPLLIGGAGGPALRRAGAVADGWMGFLDLATGAPEDLRAPIATIRRHAAGRPASRMAVRLGGSLEHRDRLVPMLPALREVGVDEVVVDIDWSRPEEDAVEAVAVLSRAS